MSFASDPREAAWFAVHDALPAYWQVGPITFDPGHGQFRVTARGPHPGRGKQAVTVSGAGDTEVRAFVYLHARLTGMPRPADDAARRAELNRRLRQAFYQGIQDEAHRSDRPLDQAGLERALGRYPGDV